MRPIRPGKFRHVVWVQKKDSIRDSDGQWIDDWVNFKKKFADKNPLKGDEYFTAKSVNAIQTVNWKMRYDSEIDESMRITDNGQPYKIVAILNMEGSNRELEVITEAVISNGG